MIELGSIISGSVYLLGIAGFVYAEQTIRFPYRDNELVMPSPGGLKFPPLAPMGPMGHRNNNRNRPNHDRLHMPGGNRRHSELFDRSNEPKNINKSTGDKRRSKKRICEIKYSEYFSQIYPDETDSLADLEDDSEFDGRSLAAPGQYPHMAALGFPTQTGTFDYKCGGSLISENFVVTAAHCTNISGQAPTKVRLGDVNLIQNDKTGKLQSQMRSIKAIFNHEDYNHNSYYNDIALLELTADANFTDFVRPIRLWTRSAMPFDTAYAMGYGATAFGKAITNKLTDLNMTIVPNRECDEELPEIPEADRGIISSQICAKDFLMNRDTCQGDSGGPLQLNIHGRRRRRRIHYHLIGITSYGFFCRSQYPSVYTRIYSFLDWIEQIVWSESSETK